MKLIILFWFLVILYIILISYYIRIYNIEGFNNNINNNYNTNYINVLSALFDPKYNIKNNSTNNTFNNHLSNNYIDNNSNNNNSNNDNNSNIKTNNTIIEKPKKTEYKYIYIISNVKDSYIFYDKNKQDYMKILNNDNEHKIKIMDNNKKIIGNLISDEPTKYIFTLKTFSENNYINYDFYDNYLECKITIDNDDQQFYIKQIANNSFNKYNINMNNEYDIYVYSKKIGKIDYNGKITIMDDFNKYINVIGIGYVLFFIVL